jgi:hypothetical protein
VKLFVAARNTESDQDSRHDSVLSNGHDWARSLEHCDRLGDALAGAPHTSIEDPQKRLRARADGVTIQAFHKQG